MKIELKLHIPRADEEVLLLNDFIREHNIKGLRNSVAISTPNPYSMNVGDVIPIIQMVLGSTVVAATVKGLFNIIIKYLELRGQDISLKNNIEKIKVEQNKFELNIETSDGKKVVFNFSSFDQKERENYFRTIDKLFNEK